MCDARPARRPTIATQPASNAAEDARITRAVWAIALCNGVASLSMSFWIPFIPLYVKELGATSDANALAWVTVAATVQGAARLVAGPLWGILSDRYGRRAMFLRALFSASATMAVAALATAPWHIAVALGMQGLFSGFNPAATALISVTVPDRRLNSSLSTATGAQYIGSMAGPLVGGILAVTVGYRGAIVGGAILPALAGVFAIFAVPSDPVAPAAPRAARSGEDVDADAPPRGRAWMPGWMSSVGSMLTLQFSLALLIWFCSLAFSQALRVAAPIALEQVVGAASAAAVVTAAFTAAGLGGVVGVVVAQRIARPGSLKQALLITSVAGGLVHFALPWAGGGWLFIAAFGAIAMLQAAMVPATNTLIAANAPRERRGTAFGLASGMQAIAFVVGPMAAAGFAATSFDVGFVALGVVFVALGLVIAALVREPDL